MQLHKHLEITKALPEDVSVRLMRSPLSQPSHVPPNSAFPQDSARWVLRTHALSHELGAWQWMWSEQIHFDRAVAEWQYK